METQSIQNHIRDYDLAIDLCEDVAARLERIGEIDALDFLSIDMWKENCAKSKTAKRLPGFGHRLNVPIPPNQCAHIIRP